MTESSRDVSHHFAHMAANVSIDALDDAAIDAAKKSILDTVGVALAASGVEPAAQALIDLVKHDGGRPESSLWGMGMRVPAANAAFANGALAHCLDFDDQTPWGQHASSSVVPAVLAVAETEGAVSGADLIAAVAAGQDIFARLRAVTSGGARTGTCPASSASMRARPRRRGCWRMPGGAIQHAFGIASQQSAGIMEVVAGTGSELRGVYAGFSARGAVTAALLGGDAA